MNEFHFEPDGTNTITDHVALKSGSKGKTCLQKKMV